MGLYKVHLEIYYEINRRVRELTGNFALPLFLSLKVSKDY